MREILYGPQLLAGGRRNGFGLLTGSLGSRARLTERLGDFRRQVGTLATELRHLFSGPCRLGGGLPDTIEVLQPRGGVLNHLAQIAADSFDQLGGAVQRPARVLDRFADVARLPPARLGELWGPV